MPSNNVQGGTMYPFPEEVLEREYARIMGRKHMTPPVYPEQVHIISRNREIRQHWDNNPGSFEALKARWRLGVA